MDKTNTNMSVISIIGKTGNNSCTNQSPVKQTYLPQMSQTDYTTLQLNHTLSFLYVKEHTDQH